METPIPQHLALTFVALSIENPNEPKHCALCLCGCIDSILNGDSDSMDPGGPESGALSLKLKDQVALEEAQLDAALKAFFNAALSFLTVPRTSQTLSALLSRLSECQCPGMQNPTISRLHRSGGEFMAESYSLKSPTHIFLNFLFSRLYGQLNGASKVKIAKGVAKGWPTRISDVMPSGPDPLVAALGQWILVLDEPTNPLEFVAVALPICGRPLFIAISTSPKFLQQLIVAMKVVCRRLQDGSQTQWHDEYPLVPFGHFLYAVMMTRTSVNSIMAWTLGHEMQLWSVFSDAADILRSQASAATREEEHRDCLNTIRIFRELIEQFSPEAIKPRKIHPDLVVHPRTPPGAFPSYTKAGLHDLVIFVADLKNQPYCFVLGCPRAFQEIGNTFRRCAACGVPGYCSTACQRTDWKDSKFPHKVYCKKIKVFLDAAGRAKLDFYDSESFLRKFKRDLIPQTTLQDIEAWARVRRAEVEEADLVRARAAILANA
ncbi:hypothetical protein B0H11DRAFT_2286383 [Mycena galericulata]|nr:hypothetical protein B0H11DRAFT_2286383 [Mycena galericulata]